MNDHIKVWLRDIENAILEIDSFLPSKRDYKVFKKDLKTKRAIERNLEIIGEAMNRILNNSPGIPIRYSKKIVDTRNRIIHGYDTVSDDILWLITIKYLPLLLQDIKEIQNKLN